MTSNAVEGTPLASSVVMTELILPSHTNALDSVFGGTVMSWIDIAAAISAGKHCHENVVTASIDALNFLSPVYAGWVMEIKARVNFVSRTSMEVGVKVEAFEPRLRKRVQTATAYLTFVAIDQSGKPTEVPPLHLETEDDKRRNDKAKKRREHRLKQKEELRR